ncbi:hypothetical protein [Streptomyces sp. TRM68416]|nr:hypothetical protein [Streptomyces sp. TRM68416]
MAVGRTRLDATRIPEPHDLYVNVANHRAHQAATLDRRATPE